MHDCKPKENEASENSRKADKGADISKCSMGLDNLSALGHLLADKFALAVNQLGADGEEIDTNRLRQLVGVMKDLTGIAENSEVEDKQEEKQTELVDAIRLALFDNKETFEKKIFKKEETDHAS